MSEEPVVIIGAGVIGSGLAFELSKHHSNILLLERGASPGQAGATKSSFAWINSVYKKPLPYHSLNRKKRQTFFLLQYVF